MRYEETRRDPSGCHHNIIEMRASVGNTFHPGLNNPINPYQQASDSKTVSLAEILINFNEYENILIQRNKS